VRRFGTGRASVVLIKVCMDDTALHGFVLSRYPGLRRAAFLMGGDWTEADRVTQDALAHLVADSRRGNVADPDAYAWAELMHVLVHRTGKRRRDHLFVAAPDGAGARPDAVLTLDALHRLAPRCRAVIVLRRWGGLSVEETADVLGLTDERVEAYEAAGRGAMDVPAGAR
jgi:DNA-directed RNA polymerase specialized sigma24 family protein